MNSIKTFVSWTVLACERGPLPPPGRCSDSPVAPPPPQAARRLRCCVGCVLSQNRSGSCIDEFLYLILTCLFPSKFSKGGGFFVSTLWRSRCCTVILIRTQSPKTQLDPTSFKRRSLKLSAARSRGTEEMKLFRHRNQEPEKPGDWAGPSRIPVLLPSHSCVSFPWAWMRDEVMTEWETPVAPRLPPPHHAPNVWITRSFFLLMNGEETQLKKKAERCDV